MEFFMLVCIIIVVVLASMFISFLFDGRRAIKKILLTAGILLLSLVLTIILFTVYNDSMDGKEVARYTSEDYDLDKLFLDFYMSKELNKDGFSYRIDVEEDATDIEYITVYKGYGQFDNRLNIVYHKLKELEYHLDNLDKYKK